MLSVLVLVAGLVVGWKAGSWRTGVEMDAAVRADLPAANVSVQIEHREAIEPAIASTRPAPAAPVVSSSGAAALIHPTANRLDGTRSQVDAGWELIRIGDYRGAIGVLSKAMAASSKDPRVFLGLGLSHYRLGQYDAAIANVKRALHLDPALEQAHTLLGDLAFMRDDLENAVRHYDAAWTLNPNDVAIQDGLFTARRAQQLEAGFARIVTPHFIVKCDETHRMGLKGVSDRMEMLHVRVGRQLLYRPEEKIIVVLYTDRRFQELTDSPSWAGGLFDGKIHLAAQQVLQASTEADAVLAHEYAHALVHRVAGGHAPTWLSEGLALYIEGRTPSWSQTILDRREAELTPLHALHGSFLNLPPREATLAYAESLSATRMLIDRYGWSRIRHLLEALARTDEFSAAFETAFKEPYHAFEASWATAQHHRSL
jgi:hypothetical protein